MKRVKKYLSVCAGVLIGMAAAAYGQQLTSATLDGQTISVKYSPPAATNRVAGGFHTDADLAFKGFNVPKGDYTVYVLADGIQWQLAVNKVTGPKAATYDPKQDLGRVPMTMIRPPAPVAACKITLSKIAPLAAELEVTWNDKAASTTVRLDRGPNDSEW
jgi:hypothetical protein